MPNLSCLFILFVGFSRQEYWSGLPLPFPLQMASPTQWTWVRVSSGSWWWTGKPGVLHTVHGVAKSQTRLSNWTELILRKILDIHIKRPRIMQKRFDIFCWAFTLCREPVLLMLCSHLIPTTSPLAGLLAFPQFRVEETKAQVSYGVGGGGWEWLEERQPESGTPAKSPCCVSYHVGCDIGKSR